MIRKKVRNAIYFQFYNLLAIAQPTVRASNTSKVTSIILVWITLVGDYDEAEELEAANPTLCGGESDSQSFHKQDSPLQG